LKFGEKGVMGNSFLLTVLTISVLSFQSPHWRGPDIS
jgi:hypothetical protein